MDLEVKEIVRLDDGVHQGEITKVEQREIKGYNYIDFTIASGKSTPKVGFPANVSIESDLGKLLLRFGFDLKPGSTVNPENMVGLTCSFQTITEGDFSNIVRSSLKPQRGEDVTENKTSNSVVDKT